MTDIVTDCRSEIGITVGLIDSLIFIARALANRDLFSPVVQEALKDLVQDKDLEFLREQGFRALVPGRSLK